MLKQHGIAISINGNGRWRDMVFVKRLWKTVKYEVYVHAYETVSAARVWFANFQFTTRAALIARLTGARPMPCTWNRCPRAGGLKPQSRTLNDARSAVQICETTSYAG